MRKKVVSYSQYGKWFVCPHSWYLDYIKGLKKFEASIHMTFGNAVHEAIQKYVETLYTQGMIKATTVNMRELFIDAFVDEIFTNKLNCTEAEIQEFIEDGVNIIKEFMTAACRLQHFPPDKYEFIGVESELKMPLICNVDYYGYIDLVLKDKATGRYKIFDFKTSTMAWTASKTEDLSKTSQVILYKALFSKKHNVPVSMIDVEFFILKRKLYPKANYKQSHIQIFTPDNSQAEVTRVVNHFNQFITECFKPDGTYNESGSYPKIPGKAKANCKYCLHKGTACDAIADIKD